MNHTVTKKERMAGVLMPVASLPSDCGAGTFGEGARYFVEYLKSAGVKIWQILPLNPLGYGNSPYQPFSSYAGDELYLDLNILKQKGYLRSEREAYPETEKDVIQYERVRNYKEPYLREAARNFWSKRAEQEQVEQFLTREWVYSYAVFMALKKQNGMRCWNEWPKEQQDWILDKKYDITQLEDEIQYQIFLQYEFYCQWKQLKAYANQQGIRIMGDVPFYVGIDSLDVWGSREDFLLDQDGRPVFIAGVPPDYFSETGQRWGNPIYNWENMEKNDFTFWVNRIEYSNELYDIIRIDHFRAFDTYWKIPSTCETAVEGEWVEAPGRQVLDEIFRRLPDLDLVAEDLGDLRREVLVLRDVYGLCGMNIAEFTLLDKAAVRYQQLIYTGTHDNQTVKGWYRALGKKEKAKIRRKLSRFGAKRESIAWKMIRSICESEAKMAIIPMMDVLDLDDRARLNTPGTVGSPNWEWRLADYSRADQYRRRLTDIIQQSNR